jgi:hypothetical protein
MGADHFANCWRSIPAHLRCHKGHEHTLLTLSLLSPGAKYSVSSVLCGKLTTLLLVLQPCLNEFCDTSFSSGDLGDLFVAGVEEPLWSWVSRTDKRAGQPAAEVIRAFAASEM